MNAEVLDELSKKYDSVLNKDDERNDHGKRPGEVLPLGRYVVEVEWASMATSQAGNPLVRWKLVVLDGEYQGRTIWKNSMLHSDICVKGLKTELSRCGMEFTSMKDLPELLHNLKGLCLEVSRRQRGEYSDTYIQSVIRERQSGTQYPADWRQRKPARAQHQQSRPRISEYDQRQMPARDRRWYDGFREGDIVY